MEKRHENQITYLGNAWEDQYGISVSLKLDSLKKALESGELTPNDYGEVRIRVNRLREPNAKSKATHSVKPYVQKTKTESKQWF